MKKEQEVNEVLAFLMIIPTLIVIIMIIFFVVILIPYQISNGLHENNMTQWIQQNTNAKSIVYIEEYGDGNWSDKYFLYELDEKRMAFNCWNKKNEFRGIDCEEVSLQEYKLFNH